MVTAYSAEDLVKEAMLEGAYEVMPKPIDIDRLLALIESVTRKASATVVGGAPPLCSLTVKYK